MMDRKRFLALAGAGIAGAALAGVPTKEVQAADAPDYPGADWRPAYQNNYIDSDRERSYDINRIVVHVAEGGYASTIDAFQKPDSYRSAPHYVVGQAGQVAQMVRHRDIAIHASNDAWNRRSIGIEHAAFSTDRGSWTDEMYRQSARLAAYCCRRHDIPVDGLHIVGHSEVPDTNTYCPGQYFDKSRYLSLVRTFL